MSSTQVPRPLPRGMGYEGVDCSIDVGKVCKRGLERKDPGLDIRGKNFREDGGSDRSWVGNLR